MGRPVRDSARVDNESSGSTMNHYERLQTQISELRKKQIFFIGGAIKSGTTWLQLLLDAHPEVSCRGEGHFLDNLAPALKMALDQHCGVIVDKNETLFNEIGGYPLLTNDDFACILETCIALFLIRQSESKRARAIGEKTPDNSRHFAELGVIFPTAKFVHLVRDGRDCAVSGWFHNQRLAPDEALEKFATLGEYARPLPRFGLPSLRPRRVSSSEIRIVCIKSDMRTLRRAPNGRWPVFSDSWMSKPPTPFWSTAGRRRLSKS